MEEPTTVDSPIGFSDSEILSLTRLNEDLHVKLRAWNDEELDVHFVGVIGFREAQAGDVSDLVEARADGDFWTWCIRRSYEPGGEPVEKLFQFIDHGEEPCLEVVAKGVTVVRRGEAVSCATTKL